MNAEAAYPSQYAPNPYTHQPPMSHHQTPTSTPAYPPHMPQYMPQQLQYPPIYPIYQGYNQMVSPISALPPGTPGHAPGAAHPTPLPSMNGGQTQPDHQQDTSGQVHPHGLDYRVTATLWEDEGSLCFQVEADGICVARREDNNFINGTKLLNVAGMTRGRRDGLLKSEKQRHVVKIGPMHLKGVWIPYDRALDMANRERITEKLFPLFVQDIGRLLHQPGEVGQNPGQVARQRVQQAPSVPTSMSHQLSQASTPTINGSYANTPNYPRPGLERAATVPTPPASASGPAATVGQESAQWNGLAGNQQVNAPGLAINTTLNHAKTMPSTPATTPPANQLNGSTGRHNTMLVPATSYPSHYPAPPASGLPAFPQSASAATFSRNDMGPPSARSAPPNYSESGLDAKDEIARPSTTSAPSDLSRMPSISSHPSQQYASYDLPISRPSYVQTPTPTMNGTATGARPNSGQTTPRSSTGQMPTSWSNTNGFVQSPGHLTNGDIGKHESATISSNPNYILANTNGINMNGTYPSSIAGTKRRRDVDDVADGDQPTRRKTLRDDSIGVTLSDHFTEEAGLTRGRTTIVAHQ